MIEFITLNNANKMHVTICNLGARITSILFPCQDQLQEMLVTYAEPEHYIKDEFYLGATCGRVCNRIANGQFALDGKHYQLSTNDNGNCLHGGTNNFATRYWQIDQHTLRNNYLRLLLTSSDGDQGFPGEVTAAVEYELNDDNELSMQFSATTDQATPINLTNHCYFNLGESDAQDLLVSINAEQILEKTNTGIPTGKLLSIAGSLFDFRSQKSLNEQYSTPNYQAFFNTDDYDHCYVLANSQSPHATLSSVKNGIQMVLQTDQPAIQFYSGRYLASPFKPHQGLCLEAQNYTDAINQPHFPSSVLAPNSVYKRFIRYSFKKI